jgi:hypothetical protein
MEQHAAPLDFAQVQAAARSLLEAFPGDIWLAHAIVAKPNGKLDKPPLAGFRTNDPTSLCALDVAVSVAVSVAAEQPDGAAGVGFAIVAGMVSFDFDDCVDAAGAVAPDVQAWVERLDSFSYRTVSGTGVRVVCRNDTDNPIAAGKTTGWLASGHKVEVFVGQCNFYNTFSAATNSKPVAARAAVVRELLVALDQAEHGTTQGGGSGNYGDFGRTSDLGKLAKDVDALVSALKAIPSTLADDRVYWVRIGHAMYGATGGSERGRRAFFAWSRRWPSFADDPSTYEAELETLWHSIHNAPTRASGAGTIFAEAKKHGWKMPQQQPANAGELAVEYFADILASAIPQLVEDLLAEGSLAMIYGPWGAGKSFLVIDLLLHVAWGRAWFGLAVAQGPALLFSLESREGMRQRVHAFKQQHQLHGEQLPFVACYDAIDLENPASVAQVVKLIRRESRKRGGVQGGRDRHHVGGTRGYER